MASVVKVARVSSRLFPFLQLFNPCVNCQLRLRSTRCISQYYPLFSIARSLPRWLKISSPLETSFLGNPFPIPTSRKFSTESITHTVADDPYLLVQTDIASLCDNIKKELSAVQPTLQQMAHYHFDGEGKAFRPMLIFLLAKACNFHNNLSSSILQSQRVIAMVAEMIHTASLVHDDVIDAAETRRGQASVQAAWGQRQAILTGDYILSAASSALARIGNEKVVQVLSQVLEDLVRGEFMQLGSKDDENERFNHYLMKTFKKTASLIANSSKAIVILSGSSEAVVNIAYEYGRNIGIAFQLVDDLLDFVSSDAMMGKPTDADLKLGLATAPVLFAAQKHEELHSMIMRRFSEPGDVELARGLVAKSDGVAETRYLAEQHCMEAIQQISNLNTSPYSEALVSLPHKVLNRLK